MKSFSSQTLIFLTLFSGSFAFGQTWTQLGSSMHGEAAFDNSGQSIAMSDDGLSIIIGAPGNSGSFNGAGQARVYSYDGTDWVQKGADIDGEAQYDGSGSDVAMSADGDIIAVGASANSSSAGHVRVYEWNGSAWAQKGSDIDGESSSDQSGHAIDISADGLTLIIGAPKNDDGGSDAGHVRIYEWDGSDWAQKGTDLNGSAAGNQFGYAVSISDDGDLIAVGAILASGTSTNCGKVKAYSWNGTSWIAKGANLFGESDSDRFGFSLSLNSDGTVLAVGAIWNDGAATKAGHARIFEWSGSNWSQKGADIDGDALDDNAGWSIDISDDGNRVAVGARDFNATYGSSADCGQVKVHSWDGSGWNQVGDDMIGETDTDYFGHSVAISGDGMLVAGGAHWASSNGTSSGTVRVFSSPEFASTQENISESKIAIYPNPSTGIYSIDTEEMIHSLAVYTLESKLIYQSSGINTNTIDLSGYEAGIYFLSVTNAFGEVETIRLEKE